MAVVPDVVTSPVRLPPVTVPELEKVVRFPAAGVPDGFTAPSTQSFNALKLPITTVASATWPLVIELGTVHAATARPASPKALTISANASARMRSARPCLKRIVALAASVRRLRWSQVSRTMTLI